jgi:hypothetical protein
MTPIELQNGLIDAYQSFYSRSKSLRHIAQGELFYGIETLYVRFLFNKIINQNQDYLEYLEKISKK